MNETSVLGRYLWVFRRIVGQMQHDLFHVYTVDQHILMVLRNVRRFLIPEHAHEYPFCSQLPRPSTGPGCSTSPPSSTTSPRAAAATTPSSASARRAASAASTASTREDTQLIEFLVGQHLTMSRIAQKEDLSDPDVIADSPRCRHRAAPDRALPAHRRRHPRHQPEGLERLEGQAARGPVPADPARARRRAPEPRRRDRGDQARGAPAPQPGVAARHGRGAALAHARAQLLRAPRARRDRLAHALADRPRRLADAGRARARQPARRGPAGARLRARPQDLFARTCGYFDSANFNILDAKVHTTTSGYALDTFLVVSPHLDSHYRDLIAYVETQLAIALKATGPLPEPSRGRISRRVALVPGHAAGDARARRAGPALAARRLGERPLGPALRDLARARHHNINLQLAKITTSASASRTPS
jgi:[protein-PII] uridylyltransferase